jgi:exopolysaccharide biosynthesis polyprenyl glycosylphosphotransferase
MAAKNHDVAVRSGKRIAYGMKGAGACAVRWGTGMDMHTTVDGLMAGRGALFTAPRNHARFRLQLYALLAILDLCAIFAGFAFATMIHRDVMAGPQWLVIPSLIALVYIGVGLNSHGYSSEIIARPHAGVTRALKSLLIAGGVILLVAFFLKSSAELSRSQFAVGLVTGGLLLVTLRWLALRRARAMLGGHPHSAILICDGDMPRTGLGRFSMVIHAGPDLDPAEDSPAMFHRLAMLLRNVDRVIVSCPPERRALWVRVLKGANICSELMAPELSDLAPLALDLCGGTPTMVIADGPLDRSDMLLKRAFDIALAGSALFLLSPLMLLIALLVKLSSPGPVFFIQTRIGQGNHMFRMLKFRSMRVEQEDSSGHQSVGREDSRVTGIGRLIRKTSLDELPQLLNVLYGDMSIVGPRPHALGSRAEDKLFWEVDNRYWHRHAAKPGLTGLAEVRGFRGATEQMSDLTNRLQADLEYVHNWSLWRDLLIVVQTFKVILHRNAF